MKTKLLLLSLCLGLCFSSVSAAVVDDSIIKELTDKNTTVVESESLKLKTFSSCENLESVTGDFLKAYNKKYPQRNYPIMYKTLWVEEFATDDVADVQENAVESESAWSGWANHSETNEQVSGVSESEIVKTDWEYIYYMSDYYDQNSENKNYNDRQKKDVFIVKTDTMEVVKKIQLPKHFWGAKLYLEDDKLVILASGRPSGKFQRQFWNADSKTYTIIYDVSVPEEAKMLKAFMSEGNFSKSRLIGNKLYVISTKNSYSYFRGFTVDDTLSAEEIIPKGLEIVATSDSADKNVIIDGKIQSYSVKAGAVADCNTVEYILPETDSDLGYPQFNMVTTIDIDNIATEAKTKLVFGNLGEIYMNSENLYITNSVYKSEAFRCGPEMRCIAPYYYGGTNHTLIHKMNVTEDSLKYQTSALLAGSPLTQYSMDEYKGDFRILTKTNGWNSQGEKAHTDLYVLDSDLAVKSSLQNLGAGENFKSSRYIGDKLFLVTFQQIDPLFVIDLQDPTKPTILGELKMPWYSTYLHPYDENHLMWIGYDTKENEHGGVYNAGVKIDLYEINYDKTCKSSNLSDEEKAKCEKWDYKGIIVKQKFTKTLGWYGSYSEALNNPRMFVYKKDDNQLLLPMTLKQSAPDDKYRSIDFFQGLVSLEVNKDSGITEQYKISHMDTSDLEKKRELDCEKYAPKEEEEEVCVDLIGGGQYCSSKKKSYNYVPKYCYAESPLGEYLASQSWNYSNSFIKRAVWAGDKVYTISDKEIRKSELSDGEKIKAVELK